MSNKKGLMSNLRKLMCEVVNQFDSFAFSKQLGKFIALPGVFRGIYLANLKFKKALWRGPKIMN